MATIDDLRTSISEMDQSEAFDLIKNIRFIRRQPAPKKSRKSSTTKKRSPKKPFNPLEAIENMTEEQREALIKQLEKEL